LVELDLAGFLLEEEAVVGFECLLEEGESWGGGVVHFIG
jgi:hypothetical protein